MFYFRALIAKISSTGIHVEKMIEALCINKTRYISILIKDHPQIKHQIFTEC